MRTFSQGIDFQREMSNRSVIMKSDWADTAWLSLVGLILAAILIAYGFPALANEDAQQTDLLDLSLDQLVQIEIPTVVGASKYEQSSSKAPSSVSVITAAEIKSYGWLKLSDILRSVRGFLPTNDRNYEVLAVRGFGLPSDYTSRVLLLIDGLRINDSIYQQATAGGDFPLDIDLIDRVEIIRGPGSALYGSSAFFGVINVITKKGGQFQGAEASLGGGNFDTRFGRLSFGKKLDNGLEILFSGSGFDRRGQDAYFFPAFANDPDLNNGVSDRGDGEKWKTLYSTIQYGHFSFQAGFGERVKHTGTGIYGSVFNDPNTVSYDTRHFFDLQYSRTLGEESSLSARVYQQRYDYWQDGLYDYPPITVNHDSADTQWWGTEIRYVTKLGSRHRLTVGTEYIDYYQQDQENFDIDPQFSYLDSRQSFKTLGLYAQDEIALTDTLTLNVGVRWDHNYSGKNSTNPRLGVIYNPTKDTAFKFLYGTAFRAPNGYESYYESSTVKSNTEIGPEKIRTYEVAVEHSITKNLRGIVSAYHYQLNDLITQEADPADGLFVFQNTSRVSANGLDLELQAKWSRLEGRASYSYQRTEDNETGTTLPNSPRHMVKLNLTAPLIGDKLAAGFETQYVSKRNNVNGDTAPGYALVNLNFLGRNWVKGLELSAGVFNVFDKEYGDPTSNDYDPAVLSVPQEGRSYRIKLSYRF